MFKRQRRKSPPPHGGGCGSAEVSQFSDAAVGELFSEADTDGDGRLRIKELAGSVHRDGLWVAALGSAACSSHLVERLLLSMDANGDGFISRDEFVAWFERLARGSASARPPESDLLEGTVARASSYGNVRFVSHNRYLHDCLDAKAFDAERLTVTHVCAAEREADSAFFVNPRRGAALRVRDGRRKARLARQLRHAGRRLRHARRGARADRRRVPREAARDREGALRRRRRGGGGGDIAHREHGGIRNPKP